MYKKDRFSWIKHLDFAVIDLLMLEIAYAVAFGIRYLQGNLLHPDMYSQIAWIFALISVCVSYFSDNYRGVLQRNFWEEFKASFAKQTVVMLVVFAYFFATQRGILYSRLALGGTAVFSVLFTWLGRSLWKQWLVHRRRRDPNLPNLLVIASVREAEEFIRSFSSVQYKNFNICGVVPLDLDENLSAIASVPVVADKKHYLDYVYSNVVDEVYLDTDGDDGLAYAITDDMLKMGVTVHMHINSRANENANTFLDTIGDYAVLTSGISTASVAELLVKRLIDIAGALVGLLICGIAFLFVAPGIKLSSPGPVIFKQVRVGKHGRVFRIYKFRTMYADAEAHLQELMDKNKMQGHMFKMDDDPRIFPFGSFLRKTSLDEFPQFWNVLKGDMSLVGTRPPTLEEYKQYENHQRVRMAIKPGITGLWQVSGRNEVTDFEEVVKLDQKYIENWSLGLDIKIILKTVIVVLRRKGSA